jgi:hypothetical protein
MSGGFCIASFLRHAFCYTTNTQHTLRSGADAATLQGGVGIVWEQGTPDVRPTFCRIPSPVTLW